MQKKLSFSLKCIIRKGRKTVKDQYPVYLRIRVAGLRAEIVTNVMVSLEKWQIAKGRLKGTIQESRQANHLLDNFEHKALEIYNRLLLEGSEPTAETIKNEITGGGNRQKLFIDTFSKKIDEMKLREGNGFTKGTIKNWNVTLRHLKEFVAEKYKSTDITFRQLDNKFVTSLDSYARVEWNCRTNAVLKHFQRIQKIIRMGMESGWIQKNPFDTFHCKPEKTHRTFLTPDELKRVETKIFPLKRLEHVRDIFIFSCYTGLAFVDIEQLTPKNIQSGIDGKKWVFTFRQKTSNKSNVPLLPAALNILEKYAHSIEANQKERVLPMINNSKTNAYLKEIADLCGIEKNLTFHMARHTFATTVTLSNGVPMETVSNMLDHTKITTTQIYAKVLKNKVSDDMNALVLKLSTRP